MLPRWWFEAGPWFSFFLRCSCCRRFPVLRTWQHTRYQRRDSSCRLDTFVKRRDQGNPNEIFSRINAIRMTSEIAPRQNRDIIIAIKQAGELDIIDGSSYPEIKGGVRHGNG